VRRLGRGCVGRKRRIGCRYFPDLTVSRATIVHYTCGLSRTIGPVVSSSLTVVCLCNRWDLQGQPMEFGHLVSTSNEFRDKTSRAVTITIETSDPVVWTTTIKSRWRKRSFQAEICLHDEEDEEKGDMPHPPPTGSS
jgi:hypothetical protein